MSRVLLEVHPRLSSALSDSAQQLDFTAFSELYATLPAVASAIGHKLS